jgi:hypothetical protein
MRASVMIVLPELNKNLPILEKACAMFALQVSAHLHVIATAATAIATVTMLLLHYHEQSIDVIKVILSTFTTPCRFKV